MKSWYVLTSLPVLVALSVGACGGDDLGPSSATGPGPSSSSSGTGAGGTEGTGGMGGGTASACVANPNPPDLSKTPWPDAVLYFIFVDRFANGDLGNDAPLGPPTDLEADYRGGDWKGITDKINEDYFTDLGVNTLWLSVPIDNPSKSHPDEKAEHYYSGYHAYWPDKLDTPEEHFGTLEDLKALVAAAHGKGLKVILDYAMNHVYVESQVYKDHPDWFWPVKQTYNDMEVDCLCGKACSWDEEPQRKRCWFTPYLPDFNFTIPEARAYSIDNAIKWIKDTGIDGYRLDALKHIEDDWICEFRTRLAAEVEMQTKQHFYTVGETFSGDKELLKYYIRPGEMLDGQFDFPLRAAILKNVLHREVEYEPGKPAATTMKDLDTFLKENQGFYGTGLMSNFLGNHDVPRVIHHAEDTGYLPHEWVGASGWEMLPTLPPNIEPFERLSNAYTVMFTLPGVPLIYYGDEIAMPGGGDPDNRRLMNFNMGNYSDGQKLVLARIKELTKIRKDHEALRRGTWSSVSATDDTIVYKMEAQGDTVYVAVNRADTAQAATALPAGMLTDLLTQTDVMGPSVMVPARSSMILVTK